VAVKLLKRETIVPQFSFGWTMYSATPVDVSFDTSYHDDEFKLTIGRAANADASSSDTTVIAAFFRKSRLASHKGRALQRYSNNGGDGCEQRDALGDEGDHRA
jgi:hypothetical protein